MATPVRLALRRAQHKVRYVRPVRFGEATGQVAEVYRQLEADFGMLAPPVSLHSPAPAVLPAVWVLLREALLVDRQASRLDRETVAAAVSSANTCPYCVEVHTTTATDLAGAAGFAPEVTALGRWAAEQGPAEFPVAQAAEFIATAVAFHYLNRMVNVFCEPSPFPSALPPSAKRVARGVLARTVRRRPDPAAATARDLLPAGPVPAELDWAEGQPELADALARAYAAFEAAGERSVPAEVRRLVRAETSRMRERAPGLDAEWLNSPLSTLASPLRPVGRLALLTALASYRVQPADVAAASLSPTALVELTSWASFTAARSAGRRLVATVLPENSPESGKDDGTITARKQV
ncbi:hypothetical protein ALI22I_14770 [Saccharothrix sp. ALI-22-I]|uniref:carboxymuconolactone decarboxylase family protein n=1 Tax=Saccharothrix sp. ALI-22-I TaxID=1933778 RepID=UPI00097C2360|nr:carboxymuconolactone decarboxylase family protein [Saccharothrix sp. ALI-22-I]ONI89749.1 hypothetical protein ALI22I_14770 [Saccharothrix sp. ALI-22-I]